LGHTYPTPRSTDVTFPSPAISSVRASRHYLIKNRYDVELKRNGGDIWVSIGNTVDIVWRSGDIGVLSGN